VGAEEALARCPNLGSEMTKSGLIEEVAKRTPHISKKDTEVVVNTIFDSMIEALRGASASRFEDSGVFRSSCGRPGKVGIRKQGSRFTLVRSELPFLKWVKS